MIFMVYHRYINIKKVQNKPIYVLLCIYRPYGWHLHMDLMHQVYTMYIPRTYHSRFFWYTSYISGIFFVYTSRYILSIYFVYTIHMYSIFCVYTMYIPIYMVYTWYIHCIYMVYSILHPVAGVAEEGRGAGARLPTCRQRLHTVTQTRPRARARAHVRTSAHTRAREHLVHARTSARPCKPER